MRYRTLLDAAALVMLAGCSGSDPAGPEASCIAVVQVKGLAYVLDGSEPALPPSQVSPDVFAEVVRNVGCNDTPAFPGDGFEDVDEDGESNFLPVGTSLHPIVGRSTSAALAVRRDGEWQVVTHGDGS